METQSTFDAFVAILDDVAGLDPASVRADDAFGDDLDVDSLTMVEVLMSVEDRFGVTVSEDTVRSLHTVGDMVAHLEKAVLPS
ncbi:acyl carrier protein [Cryptosporangium aurantiacum]|uniref:Acyl carrier protein n=1 Tax=Cryptosporangium aurantiacum TaxID=134849 RepID=A0A1M7RM29_9ACTN|nr:acyl carrier protein [Cryptosporangium aurantiacum]SHN47314.1 acyl carrier protein [Cryptosporangium aurantiacum]